MGNPTPAAGRDNLGALIETFDDILRRVRDLERATGTQRERVVETLTGLVNDIQKQLDSYMQGRYTNAQIEAGFAAKSHRHNQSEIDGTWGKGVDNGTGGEVRTGNLYAAAAPGYNISGGRVAGWIETATGRLGTASSSRRYKQDITPADIDPADVYAAAPWRFRYVEQVQLLGDDAPYEYGGMAEDFAAGGLAPWVVYRDVDGEEVPDGIDYIMFTIAQQVALRDLNARLTRLERREEH